MLIFPLREPDRHPPNPTLRQLEDYYTNYASACARALLHRVGLHHGGRLHAVLRFYAITPAQSSGLRSALLTADQQGASACECRSRANNKREGGRQRVVRLRPRRNATLHRHSEKAHLKHRVE
ncbi:MULTISPECIES: hypothetical protein [unclassified Pseudovibrio]|uniref:hypothetical protein n=1 Tax=unclassified Pseudovibrio TaxID=2627060 RepID=UPI000A5D357E|nr:MULTISPECIES: hypothetical protein [unclassified Pseudovibrio]